MARPMATATDAPADAWHDASWHDELAQGQPAPHLRSRPGPSPSTAEEMRALARALADLRADGAAPRPSRPRIAWLDELDEAFASETPARSDGDRIAALEAAFADIATRLSALESAMPPLADARHDRSAAPSAPARRTRRTATAGPSAAPATRPRRLWG